MRRLSLIFFWLTSIMLINRYKNYHFTPPTINISSIFKNFTAGGWHDISIDAPVVKEAVQDYIIATPDIENHTLIKAETQVVAGINIRLYTQLNQVKYIHIMRRTLGRNDTFVLMDTYQQNKL